VNIKNYNPDSTKKRAPFKQNSDRLQVKQLYSLHTSWISSIQLAVVESHTCFTLADAQAESGVSSFWYP